MAVSEADFDELLGQFTQIFGDMETYLGKHEETAMHMLETGPDRLSLVVQHAPITHRIKKLDRALNTLRRRQRDRIELSLLKDRVEASNMNWETFCAQWHMRDKTNEIEPFTSIDDMFGAMHDLVGFRISLYFPRDVDKVVSYFSNHPHFEVVVPPSHKGGIARDFQKIRKLMEEGEEAYDQEARSTFGGYKSTHMVVRLRENSFRGQNHSRGAVIEVQIGTIIMHSWSDIEHDIIYKQLGTGVPSKEEKRMLDLINGIVMTGEVALEQLASIGAKTAPALSIFQLGAMLDRYFTSRGVVMDDVRWSSLSILLDILKATNDHHYAKLESLIESLDPIPAKPVALLPWQIICHLSNTDTLLPDQFKKVTRPAEHDIRFTRYLAICLVRTVNMALYLGYRKSFEPVTEKVKKWVGKTRPRPLTELLDMMHPQGIRCQENRINGLRNFCHTVLNYTSVANVHRAKRLVRAGYVAYPTFGDGTVPPGLDNEQIGLAVPAFLQQLTTESPSALQEYLTSHGTEGNSWNVEDNMFFAPDISSDGSSLKWKPFKAGKRWIVTKESLNEALDAPISRCTRPEDENECFARCINLGPDPDSTSDLSAPQDDYQTEESPDTVFHHDQAEETDTHTGDARETQYFQVDETNRNHPHHQQTVQTDGDDRSEDNEQENDQSGYRNYSEQRLRGSQTDATYDTDQQNLHNEHSGHENQDNARHWQENVQESDDQDRGQGGSHGQYTRGQHGDYSDEEDAGAHGNYHTQQHAAYNNDPRDDDDDDDQRYNYNDGAASGWHGEGEGDSDLQSNRETYNEGQFGHETQDDQVEPGAEGKSRWRKKLLGGFKR